ncbi:MAG: BamA/TamA family outer membrane protein [Bacteroidota bacterium]
MHCPQNQWANWLRTAICLLIISSIPFFAFSQSEEPSPSLDSKVTINRIYLMGNKITKERIIYREFSFEEGQEWAPDDLVVALELDKRKLMNLRLFNSASLEMVPVNEETVDVVVRLDERWYVWPTVTFDLGDRSFNEWWYNQGRDLSRIEYGGGVDWYNVRGANELLSLKAQLGFTEKLRMAYRFPYIDKEQVTGLWLEASYTTSDAVNFNTDSNRQVFFSNGAINYQDLYFSTTITRRPDFYNTHFFKVTYNRRTISQEVADSNANYFLNGDTLQQYFRLQYQLSHDKRDFVSYPLEGQLAVIGIRQQGLGIVSNFNRTSIYGEYTKYWSLGKNKRFFIANRTSGRTSFPEVQPYNLMQTLGYLKDYVRGYETTVVEGHHFLLNKTNFKYRILRQMINLGDWMPLKQFRKIPIDVYAKTYFDQAYVWHANPRESNKALTNRYLYGTGFGLDFVTSYDAVFRLEYSRNHLNEWGLFAGFRADF